MPDPREERLPKWAQQEIDKLRRDLKYAERKLGTGPGNSNTFTDPHADVQRPLGKSPTVRFWFTEDREHNHSHYIDVRIVDDGPRDPYLQVMAGHTLGITPQSSNVIRVRNTSRY